MQTQALVQKAKEVRRDTFEMVMRAGKGHLGGSLSCVEILVALYYGKILRFDAGNPRWEGRDRLVFSKAHGTNSLYVVLADLGLFPRSELEHFLDDGSILSGHTDNRIPGVEIVGGSLGHGLGVACGMALASKIDKKEHLTVVIIGDAETQEGSVWEAAIFARQQKLGNLVAVTDYNKLGSEDFIENTAGLAPLAEKWKAFGWEVIEIDGHSFAEIEGALAGIHGRRSDRPLMIIAHTVKGKGISALANTPLAHHTLPPAERIPEIRRELA
ncbi:MAG: transketolase [Euryarchaeota archaeon]|nr:transketolase [Euryarchaeota archaeon]